MAEVSSTRLYLGNLPRGVTRAQVEEHFKAHGAGEITEVKLMNGFGFIEYSDSMDARDVVPAFHGGEFMGERLTVQFARGSRHREGFANHDRPTQPRPRRTPFRLLITGLPGETSWQDLKDFARQSGLDVVYSETGRDRDGKGCFVEFETAADLKTAVEKLDQKEFKGDRVTCVADKNILAIVMPVLDPPVVVMGTLAMTAMIAAAVEVAITPHRVVMTIVNARPLLAPASFMIPETGTVLHPVLVGQKITLHVVVGILMTPMRGLVGDMAKTLT
ncbi:MAG: hypothetical protein M1829_004711 [Trizodia sp. TS-e1964]|nr:MAG: hypothetical protein M1829_004711 [Trizodia sp. TS-e1964]